jgi:hypothetical protein
MIKETIDGVEIEVAENAKEKFWIDKLDQLKKEKENMENYLELTTEMITIAESKIKKCT